MDPTSRGTSESMAAASPRRSSPPAPVAAALRESAEALRRANEATRGGFVNVVDLYAALGSVTTLVDRLPPVVLFAQRCALAHGTASLRDDSERDPGERLLEFVAVLGAAHTGLITAARALGRGHAALSHLHHQPTNA